MGAQLFSQRLRLHLQRVDLLLPLCAALDELVEARGFLKKKTVRGKGVTKNRLFQLPLQVGVVGR